MTQDIVIALDSANLVQQAIDNLRKAEAKIDGLASFPAATSCHAQLLNALDCLCESRVLCAKLMLAIDAYEAGLAAGQDPGDGYTPRTAPADDVFGLDDIPF